MTNAFVFIAKLVGRGVQSVMAERSRRRFESRGGCVSSRQVRDYPLFSFLCLLAFCIQKGRALLSDSGFVAPNIAKDKHTSSQPLS